MVSSVNDNVLLFFHNASMMLTLVVVTGIPSVLLISPIFVLLTPWIMYENYIDYNMTNGVDMRFIMAPINGLMIHMILAIICVIYVEIRVKFQEREGRTIELSRV